MSLRYETHGVILWVAIALFCSSSTVARMFVSVVSSLQNTIRMYTVAFGAVALTSRNLNRHTLPLGWRGIKQIEMDFYIVAVKYYFQIKFLIYTSYSEMVFIHDVDFYLNSSPSIKTKLYSKTLSNTNWYCKNRNCLLQWISVTITFYPRNSWKFQENSFKTKIDFNEINILELAKDLAISQYSINMSKCHVFM